MESKLIPTVVVLNYFFVLGEYYLTSFNKAGISYYVLRRESEVFFLGRTIEVEEELFKRKGEEKEKSVEEVVVLENFLLLLKINIQITSTGERKNCAHTVWEASLGSKKVSWVETVTVVKFMQNLNEICQNWNFLMSPFWENSKIWPKNCPILIKI